MAERRRALAVVAAAVGVLAIVGAVLYAAESGPDNPNTDMHGELFMSSTVIESPDHGPLLCGNVNDSRPPECGGVPLVGWDWDAVSGDESGDGTTWGDYVVVGTYDANSGLTLTRAPVPVDDYRGPPIPAEPALHETRCPEPSGGWVDVDPATATNAALHQAYSVAEQLPDFADDFVDDSTHARVLNVLVTDDVNRAEKSVRAVWGGPLCVGPATHTALELEQIQHEIDPELGFVGSLISAAQVIVVVFYDDGALQHQFDEAYGTGTVRVDSELQPYPGS